MHRSLRLLALALLLVAPAIPQTRRAPKTKKSVVLSAREIAKNALEAVVLLVTEDANGKTITLGSGFQVGPGVIVTNYHVISEASRAYASFHGGNPKFEISGTLAIDEENDLALLRLGRAIAQEDPYDEIVAIAVALPLATARSAEIGDTVYVVGNPEGLEGTFSQGIISALRGNDYIQITAPISPGSSGGPVINQYGEVIGIASSFNKEGQNLNFAIPVAKLGLLMRNLSTVKPLTPRTRLRFDGLYWTSWKIDDGSEILEYLRFHEDGSVFQENDAPNLFTLNEVFVHLARGKTALSRGGYVISGAKIKFSLKTGVGDNSIDCEGTIGWNTLRLSHYNHWNQVNEMRNYRFVKVAQ